LYPDTAGVVGWSYRKSRRSTLLPMEGDGDIERKIFMFLGTIRFLI
jgi:hypothetical protein